MVKPYGKKLEDLDMVKDASNPKCTIKHGYHICNATVHGANEKQPIWPYSKIYSSKSKGFISQNDETYKSIESVHKLFNNERFTGIFD